MPKRVSPFVFTKANGTHYTHKILWDLWNLGCNQVGIKINLYNGLKHSLGMSLLEQGTPKEMVQQIFGHTSPEATNRYTEYQTKQMKIALEGGTLIPFKNAEQK